jgi:hypothetical protein
VVAFAVTWLSTVATALVYVRLGAVASAVGRRDLGRRLAVFGAAAAVLDLVPLGAFRFNPHGHGRSFVYGLVCAAQVAAMFVLTLYCLGALVRLAWALAVGREGAGEATAVDGESARGAPDRPVTVTLPAIDHERLVRPRFERGSV